jgi:hypothetical protein
MENVEELLAKLVDQNERLVEQNERIADLLSDAVAELKTINEEMDWVRENSLAKCVVDTLDSIEKAIGDSAR